MFLAEHVKGQLRLCILVVLCWMEAPWLPAVLNMLADVPQHCPIVKDLVDAFVGHVLKGLPYLHVTLRLPRDVSCTDRRTLPLSVGQWWGNSSIFEEGLPAVLERMGRLVCSIGMPKNAISSPKSGYFLVYLSRVGLAWHAFVFIIQPYLLFRTPSSSQGF